MSEALWIGALPNNLAAFPYKKNIPARFHYAATRRINFGLHGLAYVLLWNDAVLTQDGHQVPIHEAFLKTPGRVIGLRDITTAGNRPWAHEWCASMQDRIADELRRRATV